MIRWFRDEAPIRRKFDVMITAFALVSALPLIVGILTGEAITTLYLVTHVGAIAFTLASGFVFKKIICDPYVTTVARMEGLAADDLTAPIEFTHHADCVGRMARAMDVFRQNGEKVRSGAEAQETIVGALGEGLSRLAASDLTYRIEDAFPSEYERLRIDFNAALDALSEVLGNVVEAANGISNGAGDIRQASDDLSQRTEQQAASLEQTAAAMDEITGTVGETASGAGRANAIVSETRMDAEKSGEVVRRAVDSMNGIERASTEISAIISVIDGIAFQTNLLALNAGVEAARAGDAGKGFAVVASEVRALAQRSAEAAKDVKEKITASTDQVEHGVALVSETGEALERIIARIGEIADLIANIATSAEQQSTGLQQVNTAVNEMDGVTQQNAAMVEQATAAARSLAEEAETLNRQVSQFRLKSASGSGGSTNPVHRLQARAGQAARLVTAPARTPSPSTTAPEPHASAPKRAAAGGAAHVVDEDDWTEF